MGKPQNATRGINRLVKRRRVMEKPNKPTFEEMVDFLAKEMEKMTPIGETYPGSGCYRIGPYHYTGIQGWEMFNNLLKEEANKFIDNNGDNTND